MRNRLKISAIIIALFMCLGLNSIVYAADKGYENNKIIIKLDNKQKYTQTLENKIENKLDTLIIDKTKLSIGNDLFYSLTFDDNFKKYRDVEVIDNFKEIASIQPVYIYKVDPITTESPNNDPIVPDYWHHKSIKADLLKEEDKVKNSDYKVKVAVLDTGIVKDHEHFQGVLNEDLSYNFTSNNNRNYDDDSGHGTHVAGIIASNKDHSVGTNIDLVVLRVLENGNGNNVDIAQAVMYANKHDIPIINMSLGYDGDYYGEDDILYSALKHYDGLIVAAAGNDGSNSVDFPAGYNLDNLISVSSYDRNYNISWFSNYHKTKSDIFAPGSDIISSCDTRLEDCVEEEEKEDNIDDEKITNILFPMEGTSMATPTVTAVLATILSVDNTLTPSELKGTLLDTATYHDNFKDKVVSDGYLDAMGLYERVITKRNDNIQSYGMIQEDGSIDLWGANDYGQLGNSTNVDILEDNKFNYKLDDEEDKIKKYYINTKNVYLVSEKGKLYVSGDNSFNQLGSIGDSSNEFEVFELGEDDKVKSLSFRDKYGKYDENSLKIELKGTKDYYKIGNNSFESSSDQRVFTKQLQFVMHNKNGYIVGIDYYNEDNVIDVKEERDYQEYFNEWNYTSDDEEYFSSYYLLYKSVVDISMLDETNTYEESIYDYSYSPYNRCNKDYDYKINSVYSANDSLIKRTTSNYRLSCNSKQSEQARRINITKEIANYKFGRKTSADYYVYNNSGYLKKSSSDYASLEKKYYKDGKLSYGKIAHYNSNGKLSNYKTSYNRVVSKNKVDIKTYKYNYYFDRLAYTNTKYVNNKKQYYYSYKYKNNIKSSGTKVKYTSKGDYKSKASDYAIRSIMSYDRKGNLVSRKIAHYNKYGNRLKYANDYLKTTTKKGYNLTTTKFKYGMIKKEKRKKIYHMKQLYKDYLYKYNKYGKLKSTKSSSATLKLKEYKKGKLYKITYYQYNSKGSKKMSYKRYY